MLVLSFDGTSHGAGYSAALKGVPRGFEISVDKIKNELRRRRVGVGRSERQLSETDEIIFLNGLDNGVTTGAVLRFFIPNAVEVASDGTKPITAIWRAASNWGLKTPAPSARRQAREIP